MEWIRPKDSAKTATITATPFRGLETSETCVKSEKTDENRSVNVIRSNDSSKTLTETTDKPTDVQVEFGIVAENSTEKVSVKEEEDKSMSVNTFQPLVSPREGSDTSMNGKTAKKSKREVKKARSENMTKITQERMVNRQRRKQTNEKDSEKESQDEVLVEKTNKRRRSEMEESPQVSSEEDLRLRLFAARRSRRLSVFVESEVHITEKREETIVDSNKAIEGKAIEIKKELNETEERQPELPIKNLPVETVVARLEATSTKKSASAVEKKAKRQKLDPSAVEEEEGVIEEVIEEIWHVSLKLVDKEPAAMFLVKWEGYAPEFNTTEPYEHVRHTDCVKDFVKRKYDLHEDKFENAIESLLSECETHQEVYRNKPKSFILSKLSKFDALLFKCNIFAYLYTYKKLPNSASFIRNLRYHSILYKCYLRIEKEKATNQLLIDEILAKESNSIKVVIENTVDFETIPKFEYLRNVSGCLKTDVNSGCECKNDCYKSSKCCPKQLGLKCVYDTDGRICAQAHQMIVECNEFCKCDLTCPNRPKKLNISLRVFKTADRGWALKTMQAIPAGTFVIEYTGELIDEADAKKRSRVYDKTGLTYLFDLDYNEADEASYSIDATYKGNLSRFINHSCQANLQTWPATSCNENSRMHRLYYFSLRLIRAGEELTVDYCGGVHPNFLPSRQDNAIACKCGSEQCKGYIF